MGPFDNTKHGNVSNEPTVELGYESEPDGILDESIEEFLECESEDALTTESYRDESLGKSAGLESQTLHERTRFAMDFLSHVLEDMGMDVEVQCLGESCGETKDEIHLEIVGEDVGRVIGKKGQVLFSLQNILNRVMNRHGADRRHIMLDAEGYWRRRETTLTALARRLAEDAVREGKIVTFEPMTPRDRRIVHLALSEISSVVTKSDGVGDERRVRIIPVR
ncbi:MAG: KH domain-containing protein [Polyangiaceae bacterium]|nr:KH domain-containing protein [Polyangiaceae bacterium]